MLWADLLHQELETSTSQSSHPCLLFHHKAAGHHTLSAATYAQLPCPSCCSQLTFSTSLPSPHFIHLPTVTILSPPTYCHHTFSAYLRSSYFLHLPTVTVPSLLPVSSSEAEVSPPSMVSRVDTADLAAPSVPARSTGGQNRSHTLRCTHPQTSQVPAHNQMQPHTLSLLRAPVVRATTCAGHTHDMTARGLDAQPYMPRACDRSYS